MITTVHKKLIDDPVLPAGLPTEAYNFALAKCQVPYSVNSLASARRSARSEKKKMKKNHLRYRFNGISHKRGLCVACALTSVIHSLIASPSVDTFNGRFQASRGF